MSPIFNFFLIRFGLRPALVLYYCGWRTCLSGQSVLCQCLLSCCFCCCDCRCCCCMCCIGIRCLAPECIIEASSPTGKGLLRGSRVSENCVRVLYFEFFCMIYINVNDILEQYIFMHDLTEQFACIVEFLYSIFYIHFLEQLFLSSTLSILSYCLFFLSFPAGVCRSVVQRRAQSCSCLCRSHAFAECSRHGGAQCFGGFRFICRVYLLSRIRLSFVPFSFSYPD